MMNGMVWAMKDIPDNTMVCARREYDNQTL